MGIKKSILTSMYLFIRCIYINRIKSNKKSMYLAQPKITERMEKIRVERVMERKKI